MSNIIFQIGIELIILSVIFYFIYHFLRKRLIRKTVNLIKNQLHLLVENTHHQNLKNSINHYINDIEKYHTDIQNLFLQYQDEIEKHPEIHERLKDLLEIKND